MNLKEIYWDYFTKSDYPKPRGCTDKRLATIKETMMADNFFWQDVLLRHGCDRYNKPEDYRREVPEDVYMHCVGNFYGMIMERMIRYKMIKI